VASVSPAQTLTITNNTRYQFAFTSVSAETGFSVASKNCAVLQPGQSCTVQIVFVPMHAGNYVSHLDLGTPYSPAAFTEVLYGMGNSQPQRDTDFAENQCSGSPSSRTVSQCVGS
jgi:hypothetical protein